MVELLERTREVRATLYLGKEEELAYIYQKDGLAYMSSGTLAQPLTLVVEHRKISIYRK